MKCVIVAAGQGVRLREKGELKPLIAIRGVPLIERVIQGGRRAGIGEFLVVSGYRGDVLRASLDEFARREAVRLTHVINRNWERGNGVSVLMAKQFLDEPFLLTMCDHLADPAILRRLMAAAVPGAVTLAVDFNTASPLNDPEDVTRVKCSDGRIERIGKVIREFDAIDTGVFLCDPVIFDAIEESQADGDDSISGAINVLSGWGKARIFDATGHLWVDVDDPAAFGKAERLLDAGLL